MNCSNITKSLVFGGCGIAPKAVGIESDIVLLNKADIASVEATGNVVSSITLASGKFGVRYTSFKNSFEGSVAYNKGTYRNAFNHSVVIRVFDKSQDIKDELNKLINGKVVAIVKNTDAVDAVKYEIYGLQCGLVVTDMPANATDGDGIAYQITLANEDNEHESELPASFYAGSLASTETALEALLPSSK